MTPLSDISGNNAVHQLTTDTTLTATAIYVCASGGPARMGDANVTSSKGASLETGKMTIIPPKAFSQGTYQLSKLYFYVPNGTTLTCSYDNE